MQLYHNFGKYPNILAYHFLFWKIVIHCGWQLSNFKNFYLSQTLNCQKKLLIILICLIFSFLVDGNVICKM